MTENRPKFWLILHHGSIKSTHKQITLTKTDIQGRGKANYISNAIQLNILHSKNV